MNAHFLVALRIVEFAGEMKYLALLQNRRLQALDTFLTSSFREFVTHLLTSSPRCHHYLQVAAYFVVVARSARFPLDSVPFLVVMVQRALWVIVAAVSAVTPSWTVTAAYLVTAACVIYLGIGACSATASE